ncbi:MAG: hypothetical protein EBS62_07850 [Betaproteobacteria bacterium]|nr:hypothetical protein [Betaproteobacteria bacterium]
MAGARYEVRGSIAIISMDNPPVNGLGYDNRLGIVNGLNKANTDDAVKAIVLTGLGKAFSGGADIREFGTAKAGMEPSLHAVIRYVEQSAKPVVAAIHSVVMGGGLELALGCHYRVCAKGTQVALPEVKLGLLPGAGGTQRLPRVIGLQQALNMIVSGTTVMSERFAGTKLFDEIVDGEPVAPAVAFAEKIVANGSKKPLVRDIPMKDPQAEGYLQFARNTVKAMSKGYPAPINCLEAVAASVSLPFEQGLKRERDLFMELMASHESRALRHLFFAERAASKIPDIGDDVQARPVAKLAVIGAGTMGGGITMNFVNVGIPVVMLETTQEALDKGMKTIRTNYENSAKKGKLKPEQVEQRMALIQPTMSYADIAHCDMVIEAVGVCDGFIGNRMIEQYSRQGLLLLEEGCTPAQVDKALESWGMAMGPFRMADLAGNDVGWYIRKRRYIERPDMKYPKIADKLCELGRFGQKTGKGWYQYIAGKRDAISDPIVDDLIVKHRESLGLKPRKISNDEIVHRLIFALVNEAAKILEEGIALRASDIDIVYITGYGFPAFRGGPMCYADTMGLFNVVQSMHQFAANPHAAPEFWKPAPLLSRLAQEGKGFQS